MTKAQTISTPYNPEQIARLTRYGLDYGVEKFTLHAYVSNHTVIDENGYTRALNADVGALSVQPVHLAQGIETLLLKHKGADVTISSKVSAREQECHIPMLDMLVPLHRDPDQQHVAELDTDVDRFLERTTQESELFGPCDIYVSGQSYHLYGLDHEPVAAELFPKLVAAVLVCDRDGLADHAWLGFALERGEFRLRLTAVQTKYSMVPTEYWDVDESMFRKPKKKPASQIDEEIPF